MLRKWTGVLVVVIRTALRRRMEHALATRWRVGEFVMFAVDGSRFDLPRTLRHEQTYAASRKRTKKKGKKKEKKKSQKTGQTGRRSSRATGHSRKSDSPQMWLTTMWHVGTGLPWEWRTGPSDSSERGHLLEMLTGLPAGALLAADAGFVGYEYTRAILDSGRQLLLRVGSNVRLLRQLGYARESAGTVYLWPDTAARKRFIRRFGGISKCLTASGFTEAWLQCGLFRDSQRPLAENLGQGLTRRGRSGDQDIPGQVASQQSLPPLLLAVVWQLIDGSPDQSGTSE